MEQVLRVAEGREARTSGAQAVPLRSVQTKSSPPCICLQGTSIRLCRDTGVVCIQVCVHVHLCVCVNILNY